MLLLLLSLREQSFLPVRQRTSIFHQERRDFLTEAGKAGSALPSQPATTNSNRCFLFFFLAMCANKTCAILTVTEAFASVNLQSGPQLTQSGTI